MLEGRALSREEIPSLWTLDRSEEITGFYRVENGTLTLRPEPRQVQGFRDAVRETYTPILTECYDRGGWFYAFFDEAQIAAFAVLDCKFFGTPPDQLQLKMLFIGRPYRKMGLGKRLFEMAQAEAKARGAKRLYISATPSENTVQFYVRRGCALHPDPDSELFALEPRDIHLVCPLD